MYRHCLRFGYGQDRVNRRFSRAGLVVVAVVVAAIVPVGADGEDAVKPSGETSERLPVGGAAPDFTYPDITFENAEPRFNTTEFSDLRGTSHAVLCFASNPTSGLLRLWATRMKDDQKFFDEQHAMPMLILPVDESAAAEFKKAVRFPFPVVADAEARISSLYGFADGDSAGGWKRQQGNFLQVCLVDKEGVVRYWCSPFDPKFDYEYVAYRVTLLERPKDDPAVLRVESHDRKRDKGATTEDATRSDGATR